MRKVILYFDPAAPAILVKKTAESGEVKVVLSSKHNFVSENEIVARVVDIKSEDEISAHIDEGYNYHHVRDYFNFSTGSGVHFDEGTKSYKSSYYGFVVLKDSKISLISPLVLSKDKIRAYYNIQDSVIFRHITKLLKFFMPKRLFLLLLVKSLTNRLQLLTRKILILHGFLLPKGVIQ
jgi:hypothetical protein